MPSRHTAYPQSKPPPISLLQICSISALSLHKKQSSTYNKYACGCFLYAPSIYTASLQKSFQNRHGWRWFQAESSSHCELAAKECTGGTFFSVPVVLFCLTPCIYASISKRHFRSGTDAAGSTQQQVCPANLQRKNVYGCTFLREDALQVL